MAPDLLTQFACGATAGTVTAILTMPATVVRTRLMVQGGASTHVKYRSFLHACRSIAAREGLGAFYKGAALNAAITPPARGLFVVGMETSHRIIGQGTAAKDFAAGTTAQLVASLAYVPRDVIVERCAIDGQLKSQVGSSANSVQVFATIIRHEGVLGFYRAYVTHQAVFVPFNGLLCVILD